MTIDILKEKLKVLRETHEKLKLKLRNEPYQISKIKANSLSKKGEAEKKADKKLKEEMEKDI